MSETRICPNCGDPYKPEDARIVCLNCIGLKHEERAYTLADLEQARKQGAEDERGRCIEAVIDATHGGALRSAVDAIRALGPVGETREETEKRVRHETINKIHSETKLIS